MDQMLPQMLDLKHGTGSPPVNYRRSGSKRCEESCDGGLERGTC